MLLKPEIWKYCQLELEAVSKLFTSLEAGDEFGRILIEQSAFKGMKFVFEAVDCSEHFLAVLFENLFPERWVACSDSGGIAKTASS